MDAPIEIKKEEMMEEAQEECKAIREIKDAPIEIKKEEMMEEAQEECKAIREIKTKFQCIECARVYVAYAREYVQEAEVKGNQKASWVTIVSTVPSSRMSLP